MKRKGDPLAVFHKPELKVAKKEERVVKKIPTSTNISKSKEVRKLKFAIINYSEDDAIDLSTLKLCVSMKIVDKDGNFIANKYFTTAFIHSGQGDDVALQQR